MVFNYEYRPVPLKLCQQKETYLVNSLANESLASPPINRINLIARDLQDTYILSVLELNMSPIANKNLTPVNQIKSIKVTRK